MAAIPLHQLCQHLENFAPPQLSEDWDNVGLLVGDATRAISRAMTCLTITPASAAEAIKQQADLIITHHPLPFQPLKRITTATTVGSLLLALIEARVAIYSPHTAFDSAAEGINQTLAEGLQLTDIKPLQPSEPSLPLGGTGRQGRCATPETVASLAQRLKGFLKIEDLQLVGNSVQSVTKVALGCGSAGKFLADAVREKCELFITGETSFHTFLEAEARGIALLMPGHYASERFAVERLAEKLQHAFPQLHIWASDEERDPLQRV